MKTIKLIVLTFIIAILYSCWNKKSVPDQNNVIETLPIKSANSIEGAFDIPELNILTSPMHNSRLKFKANEKVMSFEVSPAGKIVAIVTIQDSRSQIRFWEIGQDKIAESYLLPEHFNSLSLTWHPLARALFVMGIENGEYKILRVEKRSNEWTNQCIFRTSLQINRLISCPSAFITGYDSKTNKSHYAYRLFFGLDNSDNTFRIVSITEFGTRFYQVIGPAKSITNDEELTTDVPPSEIVSTWALPLSFHPAGHQLIWEDKNNSFNVASYESSAWGKSKPLSSNPRMGGVVIPTPNGLGLLHWQKENAGIGIYLLPDKSKKQLLKDYNFISAPSFVPDGKGIVGLTIDKNLYVLNYLTINVPLADVSNAWMFIQSQEELKLFQNHFGLFRPNHSDQLYKLYETENYYCNSYDRSLPTRPYLVTTDIFWELFGSAYQGIFIVKERDEAIPNFWQFVDKASHYFKTKNSKWNSVLNTLNNYRLNEGSTHAEVLRIVRASNDVSDITGRDYAFSDLKPRGHYTSSPEMEKYFKAFRYFTTILSDDQSALKELEQVPNEITKFAQAWINSYHGLIAPSRSQIVWQDMNRGIPSYCRNPSDLKTIFPLSWGFDNEVLFSSVYHENLPEDLQVKGNSGFRMLPSGLDLASVFGNHLAENLLQSDFEKYPPLKKVISHLRDNFEINQNKADFRDNIYNRWLNTMAIQWTDTTSSINGDKDKALWQAKRLQTGLATWATLRHATVLVNERVAAECGESGFEEMLMKAPRGWVEPDPSTFAAIAGLFDELAAYCSRRIGNKPSVAVSNNMDLSLYNGIIMRLKEAAQEARQFQAMALKKRKGIELTNEENEKILFVARVAEHLFLVFNSLSNKDYGLSVPDPMAKIADVSGDGNVSPFLMVAVGNAIEWNHIVPFYGRHQIVKGAVYSYYEFTSQQILNDEEWRKNVSNREYLSWVQPFITKKEAKDMANTGF